MAQDDLPNGFTGFANRKPAGFESAASSMHRTAGSDAYKTAMSTFGETSSWGANNAFQYARDHARPDADQAPATFDPDELRAIPALDRRWSWVEVDLNAIRHNAMAYKQRIGAGRRLMAVVKADAYGHGAVRCARTALNSGAEYLGVATVQEAIELREALVNAPILVLAEPPITAIPLLLGYKVMPSVYTPEFAIAYAEAADAMGLRAPFHLAVNTGMNRIGVRYDEAVEFMMQVGFHRALDLVGTFTHFATADQAETLDFQIQLKRFIEAVGALRAAGIDPGIVHSANSAAGMRYPDSFFDMIRLGISLYGFHSCRETRSMVDLVPAMSVHARITDVRTVPMSEGVSYGLNYRSPGSVKICTLPIGYADGYRRGLSSRVSVVYEGRLCRQAGNICMDQCMFEVDMRSSALRPRLDPQIGDEVVLVGSQGDACVTIDEMATLLGTIPHEVAIGFGCSRLPRIWR
ncbi:alanine racemase [Adlercreutzia sp. ZJ141]|uniref:alanine racemase n=1 Tax=Adlercreutzia sp. ZJ141 TaxID=2709406 RepID=UPI0013EC344E|nr:alanine racemase [Adlercreutzia sp. ZJ141]